MIHLEQGFITISVSISDKALPVSRARVYIKKSALPMRGDYSSRLMGYTPDYQPYQSTDSGLFYTTDIDGKTPSVTLDAPPKELSFNEGQTNAPYSMFDVLVEAEGYASVRAEGVQIYAGVESLLSVNLHPAMGASDDTERFVIPENSLLTAGKRRQSYPALSDLITNPDIATSVYIPKFISVHLGAPDEPAENVYVSFPDYIKNVASSEIYPTWEPACLRANILAQISLALNRVYTEWYPSQGYDFLITNSTAYDQAFVNGRNIFSNISEIVDEIFNTYIRRQSYREPLFAQYCDGVMTSCKGMSQWGSLYLAQQGYNAMRILTYYYGADLVLDTTDDIADIKESYPGTPLSLGEASSSVAVIQRQLNRIRQSYPSIPLIATVSGRFGSDTDLAVRAFQRIFSMQVNGIVDRAVWYRISYIYSAVLKLAELTSKGDLLSVPSSPPSEVLRLGSSGDTVSLLQYILSYIGLFYNTLLPIEVDGSFGSATQEAVVEFQRQFDLSPDGIVGKNTWDKLYSVYDGIIETVIPQTPEQSYPGFQLSLGDTGEAVKLIQQYLGEISKQYPIIPSVNADGVFGTRTEIAVRAFQRRFGIDDDGIVGPLTWTRIIEVYNFLQRGTQEPALTAAAFPGVDLRRGQRGRHILCLQRAINDYFSHQGRQEAVNASGVFDSSTENAVITCEKLLGHTPTGVVGSALWNELMSSHTTES